MREFERAGAASIQIEDITAGKHANMQGSMIPMAEMGRLIHAACEAQENPEFVIFGHTDTSYVTGSEKDLVRRSNYYLDCGADIILITYGNFGYSISNVNTRSRYFQHNISEWDDSFVSEFHRLHTTSQADYNQRRNRALPTWNSMAVMHGVHTWRELLGLFELRTYQKARPEISVRLIE